MVKCQCQNCFSIYKCCPLNIFSSSFALQAKVDEQWMPLVSGYFPFDFRSHGQRSRSICWSSSQCCPFNILWTSCLLITKLGTLVITIEWIIITDYQVYVVKVTDNFASLEKEIYYVFINIIFIFKLRNILEWFVLERKGSWFKVTYSLFKRCYISGFNRCLFPFDYSGIPDVFYSNNERINHVSSVNITTPQTLGSPDVYLSKISMISIDEEAANKNHLYTAFDICLNVAKKTS